MGDDGGAEGLGQRRQLEHRVGVDPVGGVVTSADVLDSETLGVNRLSTVHDGDGHPWDARLLHQLVDQPVELADGILHGVRGQTGRRFLLRWHVGLDGNGGWRRRRGVTTRQQSDH